MANNANIHLVRYLRTYLQTELPLCSGCTVRRHRRAPRLVANPCAPAAADAAGPLPRCSPFLLLLRLLLLLLLTLMLLLLLLLLLLLILLFYDTTRGAGFLLHGPGALPRYCAGKLPLGEASPFRCPGPSVTKQARELPSPHQPACGRHV